MLPAQRVASGSARGAALRLRIHSLMRPAKANRMVAKPSRAGTQAANTRSGVTVRSAAPKAAPTSEDTIRAISQQSTAGKRSRS